MKTFAYTITDEVGIHARPAGELSRTAREFQSEIILRCGDKKADARKLMAVMAMGIRKGQTVDVEIRGDDEEEAMESVQNFFRNNL